VIESCGVTPACRKWSIYRVRQEGHVKMLSDDEIEIIAQERVRKNYPADCEILHRERRLEPDGIYFVASVANQRDLHFYVGPGGFFVARVSGEIWEFGSGQIVHEGLDYRLKWYAEGWRPGKYRLIVRKLKSPRRLATSSCGATSVVLHVRSKK
jgi:hypothetical protein